MRAWACRLSLGGYLYRLSPLNVASARCLSHGLPQAFALEADVLAVVECLVDLVPGSDWDAEVDDLLFGLFGFDASFPCSFCDHLYEFGLRVSTPMMVTTVVASRRSRRPCDLTCQLFDDGQGPKPPLIVDAYLVPL
jgi:hypothetical protein